MPNEITSGLTTPELTPNAGEPTTPTVPVIEEYIPLEYDTPIEDDGLPFTPVEINPINPQNAS